MGLSKSSFVFTVVCTGSTCPIDEGRLVSFIERVKNNEVKGEFGVLEIHRMDAYDYDGMVHAPSIKRTVFAGFGSGKIFDIIAVTEQGETFERLKVAPEIREQVDKAFAKIFEGLIIVQPGGELPFWYTWSIISTPVIAPGEFKNLFILSGGVGH